MPHMHWRGVNLAGQDVHGYAYVVNQDMLEKTLLANNIGLTHTTIVRHKKWRTISLEHKAQFFNILSTLVENSIFIDRAWRISATASKQPALQESAAEIAFLLNNGVSCAQACTAYPYLFDTIVCSLLDAGQKSGTMHLALQAITHYYKTIAFFKKQIRQAVLMPLITLSVAFILCWGIFLYVIPLFIHLYAQLHKEPPLSMVMLNKYGSIGCLTALLILGGVLYIFYAGKKAATHTYVSRLYTWLIMHTPIVNTLIYKRNTAQAIKILALLTQAGIPMLQALIILKNTMKEPYLHAQWKVVTQAVEQGSSLADALKKGAIALPPEAQELILCGQESGKLAQLLHQAGIIMEQSFIDTMRLYISFIQPCLIIIIALFILSMVITIYIPILNFSTAIG